MPFYINFPLSSVPHFHSPTYFLHFKTRTTTTNTIIDRHFVSIFDWVAVFKSVFLQSVPGLLSS